MSCAGLQDKLFWRRVTTGLFHCFKKASSGGYVSLCGQFHLARCGGQSITRPPAMMRCARCDIAEMRRRGWDQSGPETDGWRQ